MKTIKLFFIALLFLLWTIGCKESRPSFEAPVLKNIGDYNVLVTTKSKHSQMFFNQGIIMDDFLCTQLSIEETTVQ